MPPAIARSPLRGKITATSPHDSQCSRLKEELSSHLRFKELSKVPPKLQGTQQGPLQPGLGHDDCTPHQQAGPQQSVPADGNTDRHCPCQRGLPSPRSCPVLPGHLAWGALVSLYCLIRSSVHGAQLQGPRVVPLLGETAHASPPSSRPAPAVLGSSASQPACPGQGPCGPSLSPRHTLGPGCGRPQET